MPIIRLPPPKPARRRGAFRTAPPERLSRMRNAFGDAIHMTYDFIMHGNYVPFGDEPAHDHLSDTTQQELDDRDEDDHDKDDEYDEYDDDDYYDDDDDDDDENADPCCAFDGMYCSPDPKVQFLVYCAGDGIYHEITPTTHSALTRFQPEVDFYAKERLVMFCGKMSDIRSHNYDAIEAKPLTQEHGSYWWNRENVINGMWKYYHHARAVHNAYIEALSEKMSASQTALQAQQQEQPQQQQQQPQHQKLFIPIADLNALQPNRLHMLLCAIGKTCPVDAAEEDGNQEEDDVKHKALLEAFVFDPTTTRALPTTPPTPTFDLTSANFKTLSIPLLSHPFVPREGEVCLVIVDGKGSFVSFYPLLHPRALLTAVKKYTLSEESYDETLPHFTPHTLDPPGPEDLQKQEKNTQDTKSTTQTPKQVEVMHPTAVDWLRQLLAFHQRQALNAALHGLDDVCVTDYDMYTKPERAQSSRDELEGSKLQERLENKPKTPSAPSPPAATTTETTSETITPLDGVNPKKRSQRPVGSDGEDSAGDNMLENTNNNNTNNNNTNNSMTNSNNKRQKLNNDDGSDNTNNTAVHLTQQQDQPQSTVGGVADETTTLRLEVEQLKQQVAQQHNQLQEMEQLKKQIAQLQAGYAQLCAQKK